MSSRGERPDFVTIAEASEKIGVHHTILYKAAGKGTLKAFGRKSGSRTFYYVTLDEAEAWKKRHYAEHKTRAHRAPGKIVPLPNEQSFESLAYIGKVTGWTVGDIINAALLDYAAKIANGADPDATIEE